jgi:hypothetical protein
MYTRRNFKTKKAMREAFAAGDKLFVFQPNALVPPPTSGWVSIEGPHSPKPHTWYARVRIEDSVIVEIAR